VTPTAERIMDDVLRITGRRHRGRKRREGNMAGPMAHDIALLAARLGLAFVFVSAALIHSLDPSGRQSAYHFTSLLFQGTGLDRRAGFIRACALIAVVILYLTGFGVLLGLETKLSAAAIFVFSACGVVMHFRNGKQAFDTATAIEGEIPPKLVPIIGRVKFAAMVGNNSSGIKNFSLMGTAVLVMLEGDGGYSLTKVLGVVPLW
jgi:uncharacterized membrane protein YphA (DoxX/SURF4 family)